MNLLESPSGVPGRSAATRTRKSRWCGSSHRQDAGNAQCGYAVMLEWCAQLGINMRELGWYREVGTGYKLPVELRITTDITRCYIAPIFQQVVRVDLNHSQLLSPGFIASSLTAVVPTWSRSMVSSRRKCGSCDWNFHEIYRFWWISPENPTWHIPFR